MCHSAVKSNLDINWLLIALLPMGIGFIWYVVAGGYIIQRHKKCLSCEYKEDIHIF